MTASAAASNSIPTWRGSISSTASPELAEEADHHPDLEVSYGMVDVTLTTHDLKGLTEADFLLAQKIDQMLG